jgi:hypothetical protein
MSRVFVNAQARELEQSIAANVAGILDGSGALS